MSPPIEPTTPSNPTSSHSAGIKLAVVLLAAAGLIVLTLRHTPGLNGADYHPWYWRNLGLWPLYGWMAMAAVPFFIGQSLCGCGQHRRRAMVVVGLMLLMASTFSLELAAISQQEPKNLGRVAAIVENAINTSYYSAAKVFVEQQAQGKGLRAWMSIFPDLMPLMVVHARYKPPGLILYYYAIIELFGSGVAGQMVGGMLIGIGTTLAVPATYALIRILGRDSNAAWCGASFMALCPALILFFPQFDQIYPTLACAMVLCWYLALENKSVGWAIAFGAVLALAAFMSYILLAMGVFLAVYTILYCGRERLAGVQSALKLGIVAILTLVSIYAALWLFTEFDPIGTFLTANRLQEQDLIPLARPFPYYVPWDIADFALGSGWISYLIVSMLLATTLRTLPLPAKRLVGLALLQVAIMAAAALLPGEAARLWMPFYPMLMTAVGFELSRWPGRYRVGVFAALWLITTVIAQNMLFLNMGEGHR